MSEFYGWVQGNRGDAHRCGSKDSGVWAKIQSWYNEASVTLNRDDGERDVLNISFGSKSSYSGEKPLIVFINGLALSQEDLKLIAENSEQIKKVLTEIKTLKAL